MFEPHKSKPHIPRQYYYGLGDGDGERAVMSHIDDDPNPPILIFEDQAVAQRYLERIAGDRWEVIEIPLDEVEYHAQNTDDRIMLCTSVHEGRIHKIELGFTQLMGRDADSN